MYQRVFEKGLEVAEKIRDTDLVILAQYSITHLAERIKAICGCEVIGSGTYCIQEIARILDEPIQSQKT